MMPGTLIPPWFVKEEISVFEHKVTTLTWGIMLGLGWLTATKGLRQTIKIWRRSHRMTGYVVMIWTEWISSNIMGVLCWLLVNETLQPSFEYYFIIAVLWCFQIHVILQIIINRLAIILSDQNTVWRLKWYTAGIILAINISVFCLWIPARLQISPEYIRANDIWDRIEKGIFLAVDAGLNISFIVCVRKNLISRGLTKYTPLLKVKYVSRWRTCKG